MVDAKESGDWFFFAESFNRLGWITMENFLMQTFKGFTLRTGQFWSKNLERSMYCSSAKVLIHRLFHLA